MRTLLYNFENNFLILHVKYEGPLVWVTQNALPEKRTYSPTLLAIVWDFRYLALLYRFEHC